MKTNKNILFILFNTFVNDSRVLKEAESLVKAGNLVTIICIWKEGLSKKEIINGILVYRILDRDKIKNSIQNIYSNNVSWLLRPFILFGPTCRIIAIFCKFIITVKQHSKTADIIHCHDLETLPIGVLLKLLSITRRNKKLVYDAHEHETESSLLNNRAIKLIYKITEKCLIKFTDKVIVVSDSIAQDYSRMYKILPPTVIYNCPNFINSKEQNNNKILRVIHDIKENVLLFLYQGVIDEGRYIEFILDVFKEIQNNKAIIFMGHGPLVPKVREAALKYDNIFYQESVPPNEILKYTSSADIGLSLIENTCLSYDYCLPNKLFEYTMSNLPVIVSNVSEQKKFVETFKNGIILNDFNVENFKAIIASLSHDDIAGMRKNIPKIKEIYNWQTQEKKLHELYEQLI